MKKRILALLLAGAMACAVLSGCTVKSPATVGKIGDVEITGGMYLLCQYQAYMQAAQLAVTGQDTNKPASFLKQYVITEDDAGENEAAASASSESADSAASSAASSALPNAENGTLVSDYVAAETLKNMQYYAAVTARFDALGGELTSEEIAEADSYAQQIYDANTDLYSKNGFGLATIKEYEYTLTKSDKLLTLVYGTQGEQPVSDDELTAYMQENLVYGCTISVPLYNTSTYAFADADQSTEIKNACQSVVDLYAKLYAGENEPTADAITTSVQDTLYAAAGEKLGDAYAVLESDFDPDSVSVSENFLTADDLSSFGDDAAAIKGCAVGEGVVAALGSYSYTIFAAEDPLAVNTLDDIRDTVLLDMKGDELQDALYAYGADSMENVLDASAMQTYAAKNIKMSSSTT